MEHLITQKIIGAAIQVHRRLGPGLLESIYEMCLAQEFKFQNIQYERQCSYPITYRDVVLESGCRVDFLVEEKVVVEIIPKLAQESILGSFQSRQKADS